MVVVRPRLNDKGSQVDSSKQDREASLRFWYCLLRYRASLFRLSIAALGKAPSLIMASRVPDIQLPRASTQYIHTLSYLSISHALGMGPSGFLVDGTPLSFNLAREAYCIRGATLTSLYRLSPSGPLRSLRKAVQLGGIVCCKLQHDLHRDFAPLRCDSAAILVL
jgi:hypothetical protein